MYGTGIDLSDESGHTTERDKRSGGAVPKAAEAVWPFFVAPLIVKDYTWESKYIFTPHVSGQWAVFKVTRDWTIVSFYVIMWLKCLVAVVIFRDFCMCDTYIVESYVLSLKFFFRGNGCINVEHDTVLYRIFVPRLATALSFQFNV